MKFKILLSISAAILLNSCCKLAPFAINFSVVDSNGNNILPNEPSDSTWLFQSSNSSQYYPLDIVSNENGNSLLIEINDLSSEQDFLIKVNESDIDTLRVKYKIKGFNCSRKVKIQEIFYNGNEFDPDSRQVIKY